MYSKQEEMKQLPNAMEMPSYFRVSEENLDAYLHILTKVQGVILLLCQGGVGQIRIDFKEYTLTTFSQVVILPSSTLICTHHSPDFKVILVFYPPPLMMELRNYVPHALFDFIRQNPHYVHPADKVFHISTIFYGLLNTFNDRENRFRDQMARNLLYNFFMDMYDKVERLIGKEELPATSRQEHLFNQFIQLLHSHCPQEREVKFYAAQLCITSRYLSLVSVQVTGKSPKELIEERCIAEMKAMLQSTTLSVGEIAEALHFPDQSFFGKFFKKQTGITPREFRLK